MRAPYTKNPEPLTLHPVPYILNPKPLTMKTLKFRHCAETRAAMAGAARGALCALARAAPEPRADEATRSSAARAHAANGSWLAGGGAGGGSWEGGRGGGAGAHTAGASSFALQWPRPQPKGRMGGGCWADTGRYGRIRADTGGYGASLGLVVWRGNGADAVRFGTNMERLWRGYGTDIVR